MPYIYKNAKHIPPHEAYPKEETAAFVSLLKETLGLSREPVGITFLFTKDAYDAYPAEEPKAGMPYCVMVKKISEAGNGRALKTRLCHHKCDGATTALALEASTERIESGEEYFSYHLYSSVAVARRMRESIRSLHRMPVSTYGVAIVPLKDCQSAPDVVIVMTNAYQSMRIVQGYEYFTGKKPKIDMGAMQGMCSELTVSPYLSGELNVSVLCPSTRTLCGWSENDMACGIPYELFGRIAEGTACTVPSY